MTAKKFDIVGIGNAIVDILAYHDEKFLKKHGLAKGAMTLIGETESKKLYKQMGSATECSGGSAANTLAGFAMLGGKAAFIGRVKDDQFGNIFFHDLNKSGVSYNTPKAKEGKPTASCLIFVTEEKDKVTKKPKIERTMATYLGASVEVNENDIDENLIKSAKIMYFEGYLWDSPSAKKAIRKAIDIAKKNKVKVAFTLSDPLCVGRHKKEFAELIAKDIDIFFANEHEAEALYDENDIRKIIPRLDGKCETAIVTRSEKGSYILTAGSIHAVEAERVDNIYDVTGAGDLYASGFLYGYVNNMSPQKCGKLGGICAAEVIKYLGARPLSKLSDLINRL